MRWAVLLSILVLVLGAAPAMGVPAEMSKTPASEKPFMHAGGGDSNTPSTCEREARTDADATSNNNAGNRLDSISTIFSVSCYFSASQMVRLLLIKGG
jgi:hypothetical protein